MYTTVKSLRQLYTALRSAADTELPQCITSINAQTRLFHRLQIIKEQLERRKIAKKIQ